MQANGKKEGQRSALAPWITSLYRSMQSAKARAFLRRTILRREGGPVYSLTIRDLYREFHGVDVGLYTIGPCDVAPGNLAAGTVVGRYSSIYYTVKALSHDQPLNTRTPQALFCPSALGQLRKQDVPKRNLRIGHDVWAGHNTVILPTVESIGDGAILGAGSVVGVNVPPYAVVTGNPARVVRFRFSEGKIAELLASKWWDKSIDELGDQIADFQKPQEGDVIR